MVKVSKMAQLAKFIKGNLSNNEKVAEIIQRDGVSTINEIIEETSLSKATVSRCLRNLRNEGLVVLTKEKKGRQSLYRWIGGVPSLENELLEATNKHISASLLAESYDRLVTDSFAIFLILFENNNWEIIVNIKEGLTDTEIHQNIGNDVSLDSIRRILVTCDAHNLIKINRIREPAGTDFISLFEPLYRIEMINKDFLSDLIMLRGLASAMRFEMDIKPPEGYSHPYANLLDITRNLNFIYLDIISSTGNNEEQELFDKIISNLYDFAPDLDRLYRSENWRKKLSVIKNIFYDEKSDHILISNEFVEISKMNMVKKVSENNE